MGKASREKAENLLAEFGLKKTELRLHLIELLLKTDAPLSQAAIIEELNQKLQKVDRVTIYRNLSELCKVSFIHQLENNLYIRCSHPCEEHGHVVLLCGECHQYSEEKDHLKIKKFMNLLKDFHFLNQQKEVVLKGRCNKCAG